MTHPRRLAVLSAAAALALLLGGGLYLTTRGSADAATDPASAAVDAALATAAAQSFATDIAIPVQGAAAVRDTLIIAVRAAGQAEAWRRTVITAQVAGRVERVAVRENDAVGAGTLLLALDPAEYELGVADAQAKLRDAQAKYEELTLFDERIQDAALRAERQRLARSRSGLDAAEVALRRAQLDLERARVAAPFAGRAASLKVVSGQWVRVGDELMTVVALDPIKVEVQVLEGEVGYLAAGRRAHVSFAAFPGERFEGRIETLNPVVESGTRTARATVLVPNPAGRILPGMYARVALDARRFPDRVLVPRGALLERDRRSMLFVYDGDESGGRAKWRYVTPGLANDSVVEILANVETDSVLPGEVVLVDGHYTLIHDARVRLVESVRAEGGRPN